MPLNHLRGQGIIASGTSLGVRKSSYLDKDSVGLDSRLHSVGMLRS